MVLIREEKMKNKQYQLIAYLIGAILLILGIVFNTSVMILLGALILIAGYFMPKYLK